MPFVVIDFVASYWMNLALGMLSLAVAKLLCDEFMFRHPQGTKARLARLVLLTYFALFLYFTSYYVLAALRRVLM